MVGGDQIVFKCIGCSAKHLASARTLLEEARGYESRGERKLADEHLFSAIGELMQGQEQAVFKEHTDQIRDIRKRIETSIAAGEGIPDVSAELTRKGIEEYDILRKAPVEVVEQLCPTCKVTYNHVERERVEHV